MMKYMIRIGNHTQLCTISALQVSDYLASEMGIQYSRMYLSSLENLLASGLIPVSHNEVRSLKGSKYLQDVLLKEDLLFEIWKNSDR
jgi:hypothetical protein